MNKSEALRVGLKGQKKKGAEMSKVAVIGAGAAGLMVAGFLANAGHDVTIFDGNEKAGKKLYITGKGRCNLTNLCDVDEFLKNIVRGEKFMRSALYSFSPTDAVEFFENLGLKTKVERGNRVFPQSDKASDVIKALEKVHCKNVKFKFCEKVEKISKCHSEPRRDAKHSTLTDCLDGCPESQRLFFLSTNKGQFECDKVIVATGGKSYQATGSDGVGYAIAKGFGHNVVPLAAALCPIKLKDGFVKSLQGVSLKNVQLDVVADGKRQAYFGEMMFTDAGITGPIVLTASSNINRAQKVTLTLDFKPALTEQQLDARLLREFEENKNKEIKTVFRSLLPKALAEVFAQVVGIGENKKINSVTKEERTKIVQFLKNFPLEFNGLYEIDAGIVTSGGVDTKEVNPKTFESKLKSGLYFIGEVLDVDALTGGFNLQCCWAQAVSCARNFE